MPRKKVRGELRARVTVSGVALALTSIACSGTPTAPGLDPYLPDAAGRCDGCGPQGSPDRGDGRAADGFTGGRPGAWRPFNAASPWNTPIPKGTQPDPRSDALIADLAASSEWPWLTINIETYSIPVYWVDATTPLRTVTVTTVGGQGFNSGSARVPIPDGALPATGDDAHLALVNAQTRQEWGMWAVSNGAAGWRAEVAATADLSGTGVRPPTANVPWWMGHGARACGYPLIAGLITVDEMRAGVIEHALVIAYPHIRSRYYVSPASTAQGTFSTALPTRGMPCGTRVQLDPTLNIDATRLSRSGKIVARALQTYGAFVGDYSGAVSIYAEASPSAQAAWRGGLLDTDEVRETLPLKSLRALPTAPLLDNGN